MFTSHPVKGCYTLDPVMFSTARFPPGSKIFVDEAQVFYDSRQWQSIPDETLQYWSQHRHDMTDLFIGTQSPTMIDKRLRENAGLFQWLRSFGPPMRRVIDYIDEDGNPERASMWMKRALWIVIEETPDLEAWGLVEANREKVRGFRRVYHRVRPAIFKKFDSFDDSLLKERSMAPRVLWDWPEEPGIIEKAVAAMRTLIRMSRGER